LTASAERRAEKRRRARAAEAAKGRRVMKTFLGRRELGSATLVRRRTKEKMKISSEKERKK
jgi:hypothetical protein